MDSVYSVSVVIPCYNDGLFLQETVSRVKQQTYAPLEIIVVNDGSTDPHTLEVLETVGREPLVTVIHKENGRMSSARNRGVQHASGNLIAALDADDYFDNRFFEKAIAVLKEQKETAVVTSYYRKFGLETNISRPRGGNAYNFLFNNECPACAMVRKSCWDAIGGYDEDMKLGYEDWEFYIRITQQGWTVHVIPEILLYYRQTKKSTHKNDTLPNRGKLIDQILAKHGDWYLQKIKELMLDKKILYTDSRIPYPAIIKMLQDRLTGKYT